ncbi:MAG: protein-disulfide reductase DsbD N-terminal domain-containing protein [Chitinophagaceae bacterium]|nr:protein-disulfide reductase DsbD N-terminal domain-containing protein [Chitinophagaceae bacterium]
MKHLLTLILAAALGLQAQAQVKNPVKWAFTSRQIDATTYELIITANIDPGWHIYTTDHKADIGVATTLLFKNNPLGTTQGKLKVIGKPVSHRDPSTGEMVKFYEKTVQFVQQVKLKSPVKTSFSGTVEFMACDDKQCLAPTEKAFTIALQ